ncbi:Beta-ketoacyl synthase, partial [Metarhizium majus ARSEF 297]
MGHSSGEIAAAYAAKRISADNAICMSYYRGLSVAFSTQYQGRAGAMLAMGTSQDDMEELLEELEFKDRAWIAAVNSSASITISGDSDAIQAALQDEKKFTRRLKVDRAYYSPHMLSYSSEYTAYQKNISIQVNPASRTEWFSSVSGEHNSALHDELKGPYWIGNLINPVLFKQAVEKVWSDSGLFDMAVEIGPHPALKAPVQQVIQDMTGRGFPYVALLQQGMNDLESLADGMGSIASHVGRGSVNLKAYEAFLSDHATFHTLPGLPPYS